MKKLILFIVSVLLSLNLTAQVNDSLSRYSITELDSLFKIQKKPEEQLPYALVMLQKGEKELDNKDTAFAKVLYKVGDTYQKLRDWPNATSYLEKAIAIWQVKMPLNPGHSNCLNSLGGVFYLQGKYEETNKHWQMALDIRKNINGIEHPDYASSLSNLGVLYRDMGDYKTAEPYYKQALVIRKNVLSELHPDYALSFNNLGNLYLDMGDYKTAESYHKQALAIRKKALGETHPDYARSLNSLGILYHKMGDYKTAESYYKQALAIIKNVLGDSHPDYAKSLNNLGTNNCTNLVLNQTPLWLMIAFDNCHIL
jgi:tetratricopeptide (TPR) repeat protein